MTNRSQPWRAALVPWRVRWTLGITFVVLGTALPGAENLTAFEMHDEIAEITLKAIHWRFQALTNGDQAFGEPPTYSLRHTMLRELASAAEYEAKRNGIAACDFEQSVLGPALSVVDNISSGLTDYSSRSKSPSSKNGNIISYAQFA